MQEEIKKMIDKIKKCLIAGYDLDIITQEEMGILWNYITNLQEELNGYKQERKNLFASIEKLKKENKKLKKLCDKYEEEHSTAFELWKNSLLEKKNLQKEIERLNNTIDELEKWLEEEQDRLARECSNIYEDSLGKTKLVNEDIFNEITKIKDKLNELKGDNK